ncbi:MAG: hypothetical protein K2N36_06280 [Ruminiclostridium sp.]|nr:hypothetical protein [Ruminiclostridium sp.]
MSKDTGNYSNSVRFETEVYKGVYWLPINSLGASEYTNKEMTVISQMPLTDKKQHIHNLYEAVQLFQVSEFRGTFDNKDYWIDNIHWQTHKNPEEAVLSNEGCCATDTNWLSYFIKDRYDSVGSFCYANKDGNGHITTYIKNSGKYYFIDMMMCRRDSQDFLCKENGVLSELFNSEWAGFLYKCKNPVDFCLFNIERFKAKNRKVPFCFYLRESSFVTATGEHTDENGVTFYIPKKDKPVIIYANDDENCVLSFVDLPDCLNL